PVPQTKYEVGDIGVLPELYPQIRALTPGDPAAESGLQRGDLILAANGQAGITRERLIELIRANENTAMQFSIRRGADELEVSITPRRRGDVAVIGAELSPLELRTIEPGPIQAVQMSLARNWEWTKLIVETLVGLFTRETSVRQLMGPVAIAELSGGAARLGWVALFNLMAMISLNLGLLNLMPIPVLDGGHIVIMALEGLARRDFSVRVKEKLLLAGFVVLLMLMVTVVYNDLTRVQWVENLMFWR
ncbi:MAG TPA: RIP metalloprotease RseP, partial [Candidatus Limnocylindrales bacterium]|nr:RIP metalloprotease RseP [Candidatus Limnocylindrales bacterium]